MLRKLLIGLGAVGLLAGLASPASASDDQGVVVFTGSASVGSTAWTDDSSNTAPGNGLCFPGLEADASGACAPGDLVAEDNGWSFLVPDENAEIPPLCVAAGQFNGTIDADESCSLDVNGLVKPVNGTAGPSCGVSNGHSDYADPVINGDSRDVSTIGGVELDTHVGWVTSAGGSIPLEGTYDYPGGTHSDSFVGFVQARPVQGGNCGSESAKEFIVVGVIATT